MLTIGDKFPDFNIQGVVAMSPAATLQGFPPGACEGKWKLVIFWPMDFTYVCPTEIAGFSKLNREFADRDTVIYGVSTDSEFLRLAWRQNQPNLEYPPFPMLADTKCLLTKALGILDMGAGAAKRATFLVDTEDVIRFVYLTDMSVGRNPSQLLRVLDALQTEEICFCNW